MKKMPLEEALASVDCPVYGLTEEVFGLCYCNYGYDLPFLGSPLRLNYTSAHFAARVHENVDGPTFSITSNVLPCESEDQGGTNKYWFWKPGVGLRLRSHLKAQPKPRSHITFSIDIPIDGKTFVGDMSYSPVPMYVSAFRLECGRMLLYGESLGPSIDELFQILESLRVLNRKQVD